eukprot:5985550-Prymnesium_polylepis.1
MAPQTPDSARLRMWMPRSNSPKCKSSKKSPKAPTPGRARSIRLPQNDEDWDAGGSTAPHAKSVRGPLCSEDWDFLNRRRSANVALRLDDEWDIDADVPFPQTRSSRVGKTSPADRGASRRKLQLDRGSGQGRCA